MCASQRQERGTLPSLKAVLRCNVHSSIRSFEKSLKTDVGVQELLDSWILAFSAGGAEKGGFVRALRNSAKLQGQLLQAMESVDPCAKKLVGFSFAAQRFGTISELTGVIVKNVEAIYRCLASRCIAENCQWSRELLQKLFRPKKLLLLALVAEFSAVATRYTRKHDNELSDGKQPGSHLARTAGFVAEMEADLNRLFYFHSSDGRAQVPLVLHEGYSSGFVQVMRSGWDFMRSKSLILDHGQASGPMAFFQVGASGKDQISKWVAAELGAVQNCISLYLEGVRAECDNLIAAALQPLDLDWWGQRSDRALPGAQLCDVHPRCEVEYRGAFGEGSWPGGVWALDLAGASLGRCLDEGVPRCAAHLRAPAPAT